tara:strand:+ start:211 stop:492 length:282 start_codon:yes stop_codon:yes gene_type:complete
MAIIDISKFLFKYDDDWQEYYQYMTDIEEYRTFIIDYLNNPNPLNDLYEKQKELCIIDLLDFLTNQFIRCDRFIKIKESDQLKLINLLNRRLQ